MKKYVSINYIEYDTAGMKSFLHKKDTLTAIMFIYSKFSQPLLIISNNKIAIRTCEFILINRGYWKNV